MTTIDESTRQKLVDAAKVLFAQKGFDGTTVKDIADEAGVNVSLVSYHFDGKAGLYKVVMERFAGDRFAAAKRMLNPAGNLEEFRVRLEMYVAEIIGTHADQPENVCIIQREMERELSPIAEEIFRQTFLKTIECLLEFFRQAQKKGFIRKDIPPLNATMILMGSVLHVGQKDAISKKFFNVTIKDEGFRKEITKNIVDVFLSGMKAG